MNELPHFDSDGKSHMVDVGDKPITQRTAVASGKVLLAATTLAMIRDRSVQKGDVLELARVAGVMATKRTADLIPLCHPLRVNSVEIQFAIPDEVSIEISARVAATERTGVEMEALMAVSVAALTIYDMCKSIDRAIQITDIQLEHKSGGKSGAFNREKQTDLARPPIA